MNTWISISICCTHRQRITDKFINIIKVVCVLIFWTRACFLACFGVEWTVNWGKFHFQTYPVAVPYFSLSINTAHLITNRETMIVTVLKQYSSDVDSELNGWWGNNNLLKWVGGRVKVYYSKYLNCTPISFYNCNGIFSNFVFTAIPIFAFRTHFDLGNLIVHWIIGLNTFQISWFTFP